MSEELKTNDESKKIRKRVVIILAITALFLVVIGVGVITNKKFYKKGKADEATSKKYLEEYASTKRDTLLSINASGDLEVKRNRVEDKREGLNDAWTVLVYMTGSDLETDRGASSYIMNEMASAGISADKIDGLNLIVQTGGSKKWKTKYGSTTNLHRFKLAGNSKYDEVEKVPIANMGDPDTLADFIQWGLTTYPANKTMIIFWDHGGPYNDMCYDELYNDDPLTMNEIEYAFAKAKSSMKAPFDVALTHTCSNGTVEFANALAPYVNYLITTPTYTPTYGFNYKSLVKQFVQPDAKNRTPEKICNAFLDEFMRYLHGKPVATHGDYELAIYDLRLLDNFLIEFNKICKQVFDISTVDKKSAKKLYKAISVTSQYGMETNFDIACYLDSLKVKVGIDVQSCYNSLRKVIVRNIRCSNINNTCLGMAMYHPVGNMTIQELNSYRNKAVSPYYLKYIERSAHYMTKRNFDTYKDYSWESSKYFYEETFDFLNYGHQVRGNRLDNEKMYKLLISNSSYASDGFADSWKYNIEEVPLDERKEFTDIEIAVTEDTYSATITEDKDEIKKLYNTIFAKINDMEVCLGEDASVTYDEETGKVTTNFNGEWLMLGDGQLLTTYYKGIVKDYDAGDSAIEYNEYAIPVVMDDKESTIYVLENDNNFIIRYLAYEKQGDINSGYVEELKAGMKFTPIYDVWNEESGTYETEYGEEYTYKGKEDFLYTTLSDDEYLYAIVVEDLLGVKSITKELEFTVTNDVVKIEEQEKKDEE